jgi:endonuclease/exonuclease/phosphatase family metal-dependent hydrolase
MFRRIAVLLLLSLAAAGWAEAAKPDANVPVTIMTQNMDDGTDLTYIIAALTGYPGLSVEQAVDLTGYELQASAFSLRASLMAAEIAARRPELVALQEAVLWRFGPTPGTATNVLYDNLELLLSALKTADAPYDVVAVNRLSDLALQGSAGALRFTDRNALLVRADLRPPQFHLSNVHARKYDAAFAFFPGLAVPAGWISADVHVGNRQFRIVTTHLETAIAGIPEATDVQVAQATQLIHELRNLTVPVVICGDFNSDALRGHGPDATPTVDLIEAAGYREVWPVKHSSDPGATWPYYLEDNPAPPPFFTTSTPFERIDLFFSRGMTIVGSDLVITSTGYGQPVPPFASDHAGVIATFKP